MPTLLVCGSRSWADDEDPGNVAFRKGLVQGHVARRIEVYGIDKVVHGGARGPDTWAGEYAVRQPGVLVVSVGAEWRRYGKAAGPMRNARMLREHEPDLVLAFGETAGTTDMVERAKKAGVEVHHVERPATGMRVYKPDAKPLEIEFPEPVLPDGPLYEFDPEVGF